MSVINKMLRDLDSRQAAGALPVQAPEARMDMTSGTRIVSNSGGAERRWVSLRLGAVIAAAVMVLAGAAGGWWYLNQSGFSQRNVNQVKLVSNPVISKPVISAALAVEPDIVASPVHAVVAPEPMPPKTATEKPPVVAKLPVVQSSAVLADISLKMDSTFKVTPIHTPPPRSDAVGSLRTVPERLLTERTLSSTPSTPAAVMPVPQNPPRRSPALEALAQAQSLWSAGSHEAAIDLLHDALAAAERVNLASTPSDNNSLLASLARELARMELAEGRVGPALEMLTRLEPALSGFADVWAIRGNAAQRLGRHQESAAAYLMALKLRPDEPRWMLGAAVSLAAQGQTARAAELAEKARAGGVLSPELATYLRQLGVSVREH